MVCHPFHKTACKTSGFVRQNATECAFATSDSWVILTPIEQSIKRKIEAVGTPLKDWDIKINRGILTGCNEAFIIDEEKRQELIAQDPRSAEIIRPILRGRDIKRYGYNFAGLYLIAAHNGVPEKDIPRVNIDDYPAVKRHLDQYWDKISTRSDKGDTPYNLRSCAYMEDFSKPKIVWGEISDRTKFALDNDGEFVPEATTFLMTGEHLDYLLCFLNSALSEYLFSKIGTTTGVGTVRWKKFKIESIIVPKWSKTIESALYAITNSIETQHLIANRDRIDKLIFDICNLTSTERQFVLKRFF